MRNLHPTQTETKGLPCLLQCALHRQTSFNSKHKYENIFTAILLKAEKWPLKADHFCLFWECYSTHPTVSRDTFPFAKPPSANGRRVGGKAPPSKPFRSVSAKLRAARVRTCTRGIFSRSFMFDPEGIQLLQARRADFPAGCISEAVRKQSFSASDRVGSEGSKYNQEFSHPVVVMDMARWCVSTLVSVKVWGSWNKRKQIPSEFLLGKQRAAQWANAFPRQYPTPVLQSHKTFITAHCKCSSMKKCLPLLFPSS